MGGAWYVLGVPAERKGKVDAMRKMQMENLLKLGVKNINLIIFFFKILKYNFLQFT